MDRLRMRTTLLIPLLLLSFGCTVVSLLVIRKIVQQQVRANLDSDLRHSVQTYQNLKRQRRELLARETGSTRFRLIGIGVSALAPAQDADPADLVNQHGKRSAAAEHAVDRLREKFGHAAVVRGIAFEED